MKRIEKKKVRYQCEVCGTKYKSKKAALACEKRPVEPQVFQKGDVVKLTERRCCFRGDLYKMNKVIVRVLRPEPADEEYEREWLGGKPERLNSHVRQYELEWTCPHCRHKESALFYTPELKLVERKRKGKNK